VVMGVSGAGKSTVGRLVARRLGWSFAEGDGLHPQTNILRMSGGSALSDDERGPWLDAIADWIDERIERGEPGVVSCSALRRSYRDRLRRPEVTFVHLDCPPEQLARRVERRTGHFMPRSLLASQLATLEPPGPDEDAIHVTSDRPAAVVAEHVVRAIGTTHAIPREGGHTMQVGLVGLGRMGANMAQRLRADGHDVVGFDRSPRSARDVDSLDELVAALDAPRTLWLMLPAGDPTRATIERLGELLQPGDVIVEGGNSRYTDDQAHAAALAPAGIGYVDVGVSGGIWGRTEGYALMVGGGRDEVDRLHPLFESLTPDEGGFVHAGPVGAGHFTKMVHNGIEYGMMQAYAEGYELLAASSLVEVPDEVLASWQSGTVVRSWLLELLVRALAQDPGLAGTRGVARDSGEGRWTVQAAVDHGVPVPVISAALFARFASQRQDAPAMKVVAALREQFGGHVADRVAGSSTH
jgi:6-phosphogluconate dehydrogenase (decarboxylating)